MQINPIHNDDDYQGTLQRIEMLMDAASGTPDGDELDVLATLVHAYEEKMYPIEKSDPMDAIKFRMEQMNLKTKDLADILQSRSNRVYEILNRSRPLSLSMIRRLSKDLHIPPAVLIQNYPLQETSRTM